MVDEVQSNMLNDSSFSDSALRPQFIVVGGGKMGAAILSGLIASQEPFARDITAQDFLVVNPGEARRQFLTDTYGVQCVPDVADIEPTGFVDADTRGAADTAGEAVGDDMTSDGAAGSADTCGAGSSARELVVILAVKPQIIFDVIEDMAGLPVFQGGMNGPIFVSIAAGITIGSLAEALPAGARIVRSMPNMPLLVSAGATGLCVNNQAARTQEDLQSQSQEDQQMLQDSQTQESFLVQRDLALIQALFDCLGNAVVVEEDQLDAVCALSGSGPAYVAKFIEELTEASVSQGLPDDLAQTLALQTVLGTAQLLDEEGTSPAELREAVSSPGGTTVAALDAMNEAGLTEAIKAGIDAAVRRSKELAAG